MDIDQAKKIANEMVWSDNAEHNFHAALSAAKYLALECDKLQKRLDEMSAYDPPDNDHLGVCGLCGHDWQEMEREHAVEIERLRNENIRLQRDCCLHREIYRQTIIRSNDQVDC